MPHRLNQRLTLAIVPRLAALLIRALCLTLRYIDVFDPELEPPVPGDAIPGPTVYAFWHQSLLVAAGRFRRKDIAILISRSFDGELIARTVELLGFRAVRGSSSRGGVAGLKGMADAYLEGHRCAFTLDGPRGPALVAQPGAAQLANLVDAPWIGAFHLQPDRAWVLNTWDKFIIPKPFARVRIGWPPHVHVAGRSLPEIQMHVQAALNRAVELASGQPPSPRPSNTDHLRHSDPPRGFCLQGPTPSGKVQTPSSNDLH